MVLMTCCRFLAFLCLLRTEGSRKLLFDQNIFIEACHAPKFLKEIYLRLAWFTNRPGSRLLLNLLNCIKQELPSYHDKQTTLLYFLIKFMKTSICPRGGGTFMKSTKQNSISVFSRSPKSPNQVFAFSKHRRTNLRQKSSETLFEAAKLY